ncbi:hypothetical protein ACM26V_05970 [Salipaludibacillus sp. HK11]|uniref:hypothetical protein n=1 Tax=Salipaludibacillus sp. HK11 TaxID=3394320 RepID=UPI0039FBE02B
MKSLNEEIMEVKEKTRKKLKWQEHVSRLNNQMEEKQTQVNGLKRKLEEEKEDVEKLHSFSLANVFSTIAGNKQEKLDERKKEVVEAKLKYQEAHQVLLDLHSERKDYEANLIKVRNVEEEHRNLLKRKEQLIHDQNSLWSHELYEITELEAELMGATEEFQEAIEAGLIAQQALKEAASSFDKAKGWSTFDMFGGGMITTAIKHSHLDTAKDTVHIAEKNLRQFQDELLDIKNHLKVDLDISQILTFADYFFDGIIVDWMVHDKISNAANQIAETQLLVRKTLDELRNEQQELIYKLESISEDRIKIIEKA